ncbi:MAG TPA: WavE lipopolysaccharide synthesis family protein [Acetobacteraceae bacterium]
MTEAGVQDAAPEDFDAPGMLSIVVQGALFQGNLIETANHCRHWRQLFPQAEIILSLSLSDVVFGAVQDGVFQTLRLLPALRHDGHLLAALGVIQDCCDKVALADHALPLPPIKVDTPKLNNANLQIAAAQRGLGLAGGRYVLRVRGDLLFLDRDFLAQHREAAGLRRSVAATFTQRVLISPLYTLNPYTLERMPLHFSDWFHFGLLEDVRRIWDVPPMTLADAMHYRTHPHAPGSNARERLFNTRLGVEQHILYHCFKPSFPALVLEHHNDSTSIRLAMDILLDNFAIADLTRARCVFNKYSGEFTDHAKRFHCLTREDWLAMAWARTVDYRKTLALKVEEADDEAAFQLRQDFPRRYPATRLSPRDAHLLNGNLVAVSSTGILFFGPYVTLPRGRYVATLDATTLEGPGSVLLQVSSDGGDRMLAERRLEVDAGSAPLLDIRFDVTDAKASRLEVVCSIKGLRGIAVSAVTIAQRPPGLELELEPEPKPDPVPAAAPKRRGWLRRGA